jgi:hypothetical protein
MKTYITLLFLSFGILFSSCEDKERLEEIKNELTGSENNKKPSKKSVNFSAPSVNEAIDSEESDYDESDYDESDYDGAGDYDYYEEDSDEYSEDY